MNKYIEAIKALDVEKVKDILRSDPKWIAWAEPTGKNALHYLSGIVVGEDKAKSDASLVILKLLLKSGMDMDSVHRIEEKNCDPFRATPLWYAYTRGRNEKLYKYLLKQGADTANCWWAIAWYDDTAAGKLWTKHGAKIDHFPTLDELFLGAFHWKKLNFASWLLEMGADVNAVDAKGDTPLHLAVNRKDGDRVKWLIDRGADPGRLNRRGMSVRMLAEQNGPKRLLTLLGPIEYEYRKSA